MSIVIHDYLDMDEVINGYLDPSGTLYRCKVGDNLSLAQQLVKDKYDFDEPDGQEAENFLINDMDYIAIKPSEVVRGYNIENPKNSKTCLTSSQQEYFLDNLHLFNEVQCGHIKLLLDTQKHIDGKTASEIPYHRYMISCTEVQETTKVVEHQNFKTLYGVTPPEVLDSLFKILDDGVSDMDRSSRIIKKVTCTNDLITTTTYKDFKVKEVSDLHGLTYIATVIDDNGNSLAIHWKTFNKSLVAVRDSHVFLVDGNYFNKAEEPTLKQVVHRVYQLYAGYDIIHCIKVPDVPKGKKQT